MNNRNDNPVIGQWLSLAYTHPALFYALLYGGAAHEQALRGTPNASSPDILVTRFEAIYQLNRALMNANTAVIDQNILAVVCLANNGIEEDIYQPKRSPQQATFQDLQSLNVYGRLSTVFVHAKGLAKLVELRGGLSAIEMAGLAETISL